jgi:hypothetical protein
MDTRYGEQTPTVSVIEPYEKSLGQQAIDLYNETDHQAIPWQVSMMYDIMAVNED